MTNRIDDYSFYGRYVNKQNPAIPSYIARQIETELSNKRIECSVLKGEVERAHHELDLIGAPRKQKNSILSFSFVGRIKNIPSLHGNKKENLNGKIINYKN